MRIIFFGTGEFGLPTFDSIRNTGHDICAVVTQPDRVRGRGKETTPTPIKQAALDAGLPVITPEKVNAPEVVHQIKGFRAELAYVAAFGQKIGRELLGAFPVGIINLHGSLLPALRGAAPVQWAVINGDAQSGVTIFRLVEKMDAGPILVQRSTAIGVDETADELHDRLARVGCDAIKVTLELLGRDPGFAGTIQDESRATLAPKLLKADGYIDFDGPVVELGHRICGLWSWPGAMCRFRSADGSRDELVTIARAAPYDGPRRAAASKEQIGRLSDMMAIVCHDGELAPLQVKPAGGRLMEWRDFVNGRHVKPGDQFLPIERAP
jgi:methionyl-tRNA formyltransferase